MGGSELWSLIVCHVMERPRVAKRKTNFKLTEELWKFIEEPTCSLESDWQNYCLLYGIRDFKVLCLERVNLQVSLQLTVID